MTASLRMKFRVPPKGLVAGCGLCLLVPDGDWPFPAAWGAQFNISSGDEEGCFDVMTDPETNEETLNALQGKPHDTSPGRVTAVSECPGRPASGQLCHGSPHQNDTNIKHYFRCDFKSFDT